MATLSRSITVTDHTQPLVVSLDVPKGSNRHFRVQAYDSSGNLLYQGDAYSNVSTAVSLNLDLQAAAPLQFAGIKTAQAITPTQIDLSWDPAQSALVPSSGMVYLVYMATTPGGENFTSPTFTTSAGVSGYSVTNLAPGVTYYFVVRASDGAGTVDSNTVERSARTASAVDTTPPVFGGLGSARYTLETNTIDLSWVAAVDETTPAADIRYEIFWSTKSLAQNFALPQGSVTGATNFTISNPVAGTYYFIVRARDKANNTDLNTREITISFVDVIPPVFGGVTTASYNATANSIDLTWSAATDNVTPQAEIRYEIFWSATSGSGKFSTSPTGVTGVTSYALPNPGSGGTLYLSVRARDKAGNSDQNIKEIAVTTPVVTPPVVILNPVVTAVTATNGVNLIPLTPAANGGRAYTSATDPLVPNSQIFNNISSARSGASPSPATFTGIFYAGSGASTSTDYYALVQFSNPMNATTVINPASWSIVDTAAPLAPSVAISKVVGTDTNGGVYLGGCLLAAPCNAVVTVTVVSVTYNAVSQTATIRYRLNWSYTQAVSETPSANIGLGSRYRIGVPEFYFKFDGMDTNGNTLAYPALQKGF
jgi:hypothetical protein